MHLCKSAINFVIQPLSSYGYRYASSIGWSCPMGYTFETWQLYCPPFNFKYRSVQLQSSIIDEYYRRSTFITFSIYVRQKFHVEGRRKCVKKNYLAGDRFKKLVNHSCSHVSSSHLRVRSNLWPHSAANSPSRFNNNHCRVHLYDTRLPLVSCANLNI